MTTSGKMFNLPLSLDILPGAALLCLLLP